MSHLGHRRQGQKEPTPLVNHGKNRPMPPRDGLMLSDGRPFPEGTEAEMIRSFFPEDVRGREALHKEVVARLRRPVPQDEFEAALTALLSRGLLEGAPNPATKETRSPFPPV